MTWITDTNGTRWVEIPQGKRHKSPRALRFANLKVGDQVMKVWNCPFSRVDKWYYVVTDLWFDPCRGSGDPVSGQMVAIMALDHRTGEPRSHKEPHTLHSLASNGFHYSDIDFPALVQARNAAMATGDVIGIGRSHAIRRRPKLIGGSL